MTTMTTLRKLEIGGLLAALLVAGLFLRGWMAERDARNTAEAFAKAQTVKADALAAQISASKDSAAAYEAGKAAAAAAITTPQQAVKIITQYLPAPPAAPGEAAPAPVAIPIVSANELDADLRAKLPPAPSYAILTPDQSEAIAKNDLACDAAQHSLAACSVQLGDETQIAALNQAKADKFEQAMKGGTWKQRVGKVLKSAACAGGGSAIAALATRSSPASTQFGSVAVGAAGGAIACSIF
jgi:hypothetical protein